MQRFQKISGLTVTAPGAKQIVMSALDTAIARMPGIVSDVDVARLVGIGAAGRARISGGLVTTSGSGVSRVASSAYVNNKPALRMNGSVGHRVALGRGLTGPNFTLVWVGTIGAAIRNSVPAANKNLFTLYNAGGAAIQIWCRLVSGTGALSFNLLGSGGASLAQASLPAADTACILSFHRSGTAVVIRVNGDVVASATDSDTTDLGDDYPLYFGGLTTVSNTLAWTGDMARALAFNGDVALLYPDLWANMIALAKTEYGVAA